MPQIVLTLLQGLFLLLFYVFVARAVRAVLRDVAVSSRQRRRPTTAAPQAARGGAKSKRAPAPSPTQGSGAGEGPAPRVAPREIVVHNREGRPRVFALDGREISFGRSAETTVPIDDPYTSDRHARIYHDGRAWVVHDLGSTNGTFVNQVKVTDPTPISAGDQLGIGRTVVEVRK